MVLLNRRNPLYALLDLRKNQAYAEGPRGAAAVQVGPDDVVADIGANIGVFALRCARAGAARVTAYEPGPWAAEVLRMNAGLASGMEAVEAAVVGESGPGTATFNVSVESLGSTNSLVSRPRRARSITVPTVAFADAVRGATVVKVDVEGAEYGYPLEVVTARALFLSFHSPRPTWRVEANRLIAGLLSRGYKAVVEPNFTRANKFRESLWVR
jgi:FkbM family methyltransferase